MQIQSVATQLLLQSQTRKTALADSPNERGVNQIVAIANQHIGPAPSNGGLLPSFDPVYELVARHRSQDVFADKDIVKTQAIYDDQAVLKTELEGVRDLSDFDKVFEAGIKKGSKFSVTVGSDPTAVLKFKNSKTITVTVNGSTEEFSFNSKDGSFRAGLTAALSSISGLSASYAEDGKLSLSVNSGQVLELADVSKSPLGKLGLTEGTTNPEVIGYQQVKVGEQQVVVGSETMKVGTEQVVDGYDRELIGLERSNKATLDMPTVGSGYRVFGQSPSSYADLLFSTLPIAENPAEASGSVAKAASAYNEA